MDVLVGIPNTLPFEMGPSNLSFDVQGTVVNMTISVNFIDELSKFQVYVLQTMHGNIPLPSSIMNNNCLYYEGLSTHIAINSRYHDANNRIWVVVIAVDRLGRKGDWPDTSGFGSSQPITARAILSLDDIASGTENVHISAEDHQSMVNQFETTSTNTININGIVSQGGYTLPIVVNN